jgi:F-type H+-transporting ATPase subunit epsilon
MLYQLQVLTPEQIVFDDEVASLIAAGEQGYLGVLANHAPLITSLKAGLLIITDKHNKRFYYNASTGFLEVSRNKASIIVKTIEPREPVHIGVEEGI